MALDDTNLENAAMEYEANLPLNTEAKQALTDAAKLADRLYRRLSETKHTDPRDARLAADADHLGCELRRIINMLQQKAQKIAVSRWYYLAEDGKWYDCNTGKRLVLKKSDAPPATFEMKRNGKRALCVTR
jgi:hypothetical protein